MKFQSWHGTCLYIAVGNPAPAIGDTDMSHLLDRLQSQQSVKIYQLESQSHDYQTADQWAKRDYDVKQAAEREAQSQQAYNARLRAAHAVQESKEGATGVNAWNQIEDDSILSAEILAVLASDPDAMSAAERAGFECTGFDLLDSEIAVADFGVASYAVKGEACWSETIQYDESGKPVTTGFNAEAFERKQAKTTKTRAFHDIEFVLDTKGRVRASLTTQTKGNAQSKADMIAEAQAKIEANRAKKLARMARKFG
jgi:hypothetical protein